MIRTTSYSPVLRFDLARTLGGRGRYWTTAYYVDGLLIDSGCAHCAVEFSQALKGCYLEYLVNTHSHEDHIGANGRLQRERPALALYAHPLALEILADPHHKQPLHFYRRLFWGWPEPSQAHALGDGEIIETAHHCFQVFYTPGHSADHLCLFEPHEGWLFSGDLFVGGRERALRAEGDIWQIIASLKRMAALQPRILFPGSARVRENPQEELRVKIAYLEDLGDKVLDLHRKGWDLAAIVRAVCGGPMVIEWITAGDFARKHLVLSYLKGDCKKALFSQKGQRIPIQ